MTLLPVPHEAPPTHRTRDVVKEDFCLFLGIFRHIQKTVLIRWKDRKIFNFHVISTLSFFRRKSDVYEMMEAKIFHLLGPCQQEGPIWWKNFQLKKTNLFEAKWWTNLTMMSTRNVKNTWPSVSSFSPLPPSPFPSTSFLSSWTPKTLQFKWKNAKNSDDSDYFKASCSFVTNQWQMFPWMFFSQWILSTLLISSCSDTNIADMSNICFIVRSFVFLMECQLTE